MLVRSRSYVGATLRNAALFLLALLACVPALASGGAILGTTLTTIPGGDDEAHRVLVQPDGKIVTIGFARYGTQQFSLVRYNSDGTLDTTFNGTGTRLEFLAQGESQAWAGLLQPDGKIVAGGYAVSDRSRFGIARFNSDGSLDTSFGGGGKVVAVGSGDAGGYAMALQSDGKILMGGYSMSGGHKVFTVVRFTTTDGVDTTYGNGGFYVAAAGSSDAVIHSMLIQSDGKVLVAGDGGGANTIQVQRLNADGTLDTTFASGGTATFSNMTGAWDMTLQSDGKILIAGSSLHPATSQSSAFWDLAVLRANADGTLDTTFGNTFGNNGIGYIFEGSSSSTSDNTAGYGVVANSDGTIVVSGTVSFSTAQGTVSVAALGRLLADGSSDTRFGQSGHTEIGHSTGGAVHAKGYGIAKTSSGDLVVAGGTNPDATTPSKQDSDSLAAEFDASGASTNFGGIDGFVIHDLGSQIVEANGSVMQPDGKLVVVGTTTAEDHASPGNGTKTGVVARYLANGTLDTSFGTSGITLLATNSEANAVALQSNGMIVIGGVLHTGSVPAMWFTRVNTNGSVDTSFGSGGTFSTTLGSTSEGITSIAVQSDGKIVAGGFVQNGSFSDSAFVRLTSAGALDSAFNGSGLSVVGMTTGSDQVNGLAIQGDGKIVGAGWAEVSGSQQSFGAVRVNSDGTPDSSFGTSGVAIVNFGTHISHGFALVLQPDGKIVIGGSMFNGSTDDFAIARLLSNGTLDTSFGSGGTQSNDFGNHNRIFALALLSSGKLIGAGETGGLYAAVQYLSNGTLDTAYGTGGSTTTVMNAGIDHANAISVGTDGTVYASGDASGLIGVLRLSADGSTTKVASTTSLASSVNPSTTGQSVTFTATVTGSSVTPTGSVTFDDGATALCTTVTLTGGTATCTTASLAAGSHSISASYSGDANYDASTSNTVTQTVSAPGQFTLSITKSGSGTVTSSPAGINCGATCSASFTSGTSVTLSAVADSGFTFAGWSGGGCSGTAGCTVTMNAAASVSATFSATTNPERLGNISTRGVVLTGNDVMIGGFIIGGSTNKTVAIVATGPSLAAFGVTNALQNPTITLVRSSDQSVVATNDDWQSDVNASQLQASGFAPSDPRESGLYVNLPPGAYTVIVSGVGNTTGVAVIGVFEVDHPETPLVNISTRGKVLTGNNVMIGGFIIDGNNPKTVAVTATGPSLAAFGVTNPLANPQLTIVRSSDQSVVATNDDWQSDPNAAQLQAKGFAPADAREPGLLLTLPPGAYTAIVSGVNNTTGTAVIGVFDAQ